MKEKIKHALKILFTVLGIIAIVDWVIVPGLNEQNTVINILTFLLAGVVSTVFGVMLWNRLTEIEEEEKKDDEDETI